MNDNKRKNLIRIIVAIIICLVIVSIPLTVKFVADSKDAPSHQESLPNNDVEGEPSEDEKGDIETETVPKADIKVVVSIDARAIFTQEGRQYIDDIRLRMGDELFDALNIGDVLSNAEIVVKEGSTVRDVMAEVDRTLGIVVSGSYNYIAAIGGLAEKMASPTSGWVYTVNGERVMVGVGSYMPKAGDYIEWRYILGISNKDREQ